MASEAEAALVLARAVQQKTAKNVDDVMTYAISGPFCFKPDPGNTCIRWTTVRSSIMSHKLHNWNTHFLSYRNWSTLMSCEKPIL